MAISRQALAEWVGREILPHERDLRLWLRRRFVLAGEVEDIVQECYCRMAQLNDVDHIREPRAYLFTIARNIAQEHRRRASVVRLEPLGDTDRMGTDYDALSPERIAAGKQELGRLEMALAALSDRARRIFLMRKVEGLSQKEIARNLGVSETIVENDATRSLKAILKFMTAPDMAEGETTDIKRQRARPH